MPRMNSQQCEVVWWGLKNQNIHLSSAGTISRLGTAGRTTQNSRWSMLCGDSPRATRIISMDPRQSPREEGSKLRGVGIDCGIRCCYPAQTFPTFYCCMAIVSYFGSGMPEFRSVYRSWFYFAVCAQVSLMAKKSARNPRPPVMFSTIGIVRPQLQYKHKAPQMELAHSLFH